MNTITFLSFVGIIAFVSSPSASGLSIKREYCAPGRELAGFGTTAQQPPPSAIGSGDGNLEDIFNAAARYWENVIKDDGRTIYVTYGWHRLEAPDLAATVTRSSNGVIDSITTGFDNTSRCPYFFDPTPDTSFEYTNFDSSDANFATTTGTEVRINSGRVYRKIEALRDQSYDLLTVAIHELGHALGMDYYGSNTLEIKSPRPSAGTLVPLIVGEDREPHLSLRSSVMWRSSIRDVRTLPSVIDILAVAQVGDFRELNLLTNLKVYQPSRWEAKVVFHFDDRGNVFIDFAGFNDSDVVIRKDFSTSVYLDADKAAIEDKVRLRSMTPLKSWRQTADVWPRRDFSRKRQLLGKIGSGQHVLSLVLDAKDEVIESRGKDNIVHVPFEVP